MSQIFAVVSTLVLAAIMAMWIVRWAPNRRIKLTGLTGLAVLLVATAGIGMSGALEDFTQTPPPFMLFLAGLMLVTIAVVLSPWGSAMTGATSLRVLIGLQAFRVLPESLLDLAWRDGLAPIQMTSHGRNFDILTALAAAVLAGAWPRLAQQRKWAWAFTLLGGALLANILVIAVLSAPGPLRVFMDEPANTFVTRFPYVWLPGFQVVAAVLLHGLTIRKLLRRLQK